MEEPALTDWVRIAVEVGSVRTARDGGAAAVKAVPERALAGARLTIDQFWPAAGVSMVPRVCVE
jgi:hypothetical protein